MNLESISARDLMTTKIVYAEPEDALNDAITRMAESAIHSLVIRPSHPNRGHCILTTKDCIEVLCTAGEAAISALRVEDVMTRPALTVPAELCISDCIQLMRHAGVRTAPVVDGSTVVGVLTFTDVLHALADTA